MTKRNHPVHVCSAALLVIVSGLLLPGRAQSEPVNKLRTLTFNVWVGGNNVNGGLDKIIEAIEDSGADVVAMQESNGAAAQAAQRLGWFSYQPASSVAIVSRYPIIQTFPPTLNNAGAGARIQLSADPPQDIIFWSSHLTAYPYGPYQACFDGTSVNKIVRTQRRVQLKEMNSILDAMSPFLADADNIPVFLLGDFNTPSHLDWVRSTAETHCGYVINYPVTEATAAAGLIDSYREIHPDPLPYPGDTWSPIFPFNRGESSPEPQDRIDQVHFAGAGVTPLSATVFVTGLPSDYPNHADNQWPSDHAGVIADFDLVPGGGGGNPPPSDLSLDKNTYASGEAIVASYSGGPGNAEDWIGIYDAGQVPGSVDSTAWFYTNNSQQAGGGDGPTDGFVTFDNSSQPIWPLAEGNYSAYFLCCDNYQVLAGPIDFGVANDGEPCIATSLHVEGITLSVQSVGRGQKLGTATVAIADNCNQPLSDPANVTGTFSGDYTEGVSAQTDGNGNATLVTNKTAGGKVSFAFCVDDVQGSLLYFSDDNVNPCDSR